MRAALLALALAGCSTAAASERHVYELTCWSGGVEVVHECGWSASAESRTLRIERIERDIVQATGDCRLIKFRRSFPCNSRCARQLAECR